MAGGMPTFRQFIMSDQLKGFLTYMDYFATGEGRTVELKLSLVNNEAEAKEKHLDMFVGTRQEARDYFGHFIEVMPIESDKAKELLSHIFKFGAGLHKDLAEAGIEFHFKYYVNRS